VSEIQIVRPAEEPRPHKWLDLKKLRLEIRNLEALLRENKRVMRDKGFQPPALQSYLDRNELRDTVTRYYSARAAHRSRIHALRRYIGQNKGQQKMYEVTSLDAQLRELYAYGILEQFKWTDEQRAAEHATHVAHKDIQ
jgi:hypothetical protein